MEYEKLLEEADGECLIIKEKPLKAYSGRIKGNKIAIKKDMNMVDKACTLAEELGHYHTTVGNILDQSSASSRKQERRARIWAYNKMIGLNGIIRAYEHGCRSKSDMADYLDVTEEFLQEAINCYTEKYGLYKEIDNYMILFQPLGVLELYK